MLEKQEEIAAKDAKEKEDKLRVQKQHEEDMFKLDIKRAQDAIKNEGNKKKNLKKSEYDLI